MILTSIILLYLLLASALAILIGRALKREARRYPPAHLQIQGRVIRK